MTRRRRRHRSGAAARRGWRGRWGEGVLGVGPADGRGRVRNLGLAAVVGVGGVVAAPAVVVAGGGEGGGGPGLGLRGVVVVRAVARG